MNLVTRRAALALLGREMGDFATYHEENACSAEVRQLIDRIESELHIRHSEDRRRGAERAIAEARADINVRGRTNHRCFLHPEGVECPWAPRGAQVR